MGGGWSEGEGRDEESKVTSKVTRKIQDSKCDRISMEECGVEENKKEERTKRVEVAEEVYSNQRGRGG